MLGGGPEILGRGGGGIRGGPWSLWNPGGGPWWSNDKPGGPGWLLGGVLMGSMRPGGGILGGGCIGGGPGLEEGGAGGG